MSTRFRKLLRKVTPCVVFLCGFLAHNLVTHLHSTDKFSDCSNAKFLLPEEFISTKHELANHQVQTQKLNIEPRLNLQKQKRILIWNNYWDSKALWNKVFSEIIHGTCPVSNCILTLDKLEFKTSDAVLFHLVDLHNNSIFPEHRFPKQIWIAMTYEPPLILHHAGINLSALNGIFNRTMSYRTDSDIVVRHGKYHSIDESPENSNFPNYVSNWINSRDDWTIRNYAEGKKRLVSWFASSRRCKSHSGREVYVQELQEYIEVDIYGSCGTYKCGSTKTLRNPYKVEYDDCYYLVSVGYKFVLAFENSICEDYVTEKLYNNLKLNVVPVVFGGSNYSYYAPPHSVIDASTLTPKELAEYLLILDKNDTLYNEYFSWKKKYYIESHDGVPLACDLCQKINEPSWQVEEKVYNQFDTWITSKCETGYSQAQLNPQLRAA